MPYLYIYSLQSVLELRLGSGVGADGRNKDVTNKCIGVLTYRPLSAFKA